MKFHIRRTSDWVGLEPPHPSAYRSEGPAWPTDWRTSKTFEEFDAKLSLREGPFLSKGRNHTEVIGGISRELPSTTDNWYIDLPDLESLVEFTKANGELVISFDTEPEIEIYDGYRE